jgi:hypothetical protein
MVAPVKRLALPLALAALFLVPAARAASPNHSPFNDVPVSGTSADGNAFSGTMDILGFTNDGGVVKAIASLTGTITPAAGAVRQVSGVLVLVPVNVPGTAAATTGQLRGGFGGAENDLTTQLAPAQQQASCNILHLVLGPLNLNLLGLNVSLNQVVLDITAVPGAGNLLGNLLCAVANLLNNFNLGNIVGTALTNSLTTLLNNLLMGLGL